MDIVQDITMNLNLKSLMKFIKDEKKQGNFEPSEEDNIVERYKKQVRHFVLLIAQSI
jgi:hypothetical protein